MQIDTRRVRLLGTPFALAALALGLVGIVVLGIGVRQVVAAPYRLLIDDLGGVPTYRAAAIVGDGEVGVTQAASELAVSKTAGVASVSPGDVLTYTIVVTNLRQTGPPLWGVMITDTLPNLTAFQGGTEEWQESAPGVWTYSVGKMEKDSSEVLTLTVKLTDTLPADTVFITNTVEATDDGDAYARDTHVAEVTAVEAAPELAVSKIAERDAVAPGETITYTITITNTGDREATGVVVTDTLPNLTTFQDGTGGREAWHESATGVYTYFVGEIEDNASEMLTLTVKLTDTLPAGTIFITNTVEATDDADAYAKDTEVTAVEAAPELAVSKIAERDAVAPGETITYTITITNTGDREATGVVVTDTLPALTTFESGTPDWTLVSGSAYTYALDSLLGAQERVLTLTVKLTDTLPATTMFITNTVEATDDADAYAKDTEVTAVEAAPELAISKVADRDAVAPGETITYTITITNTGDREATGVVVTDTLPDLTTFDADTSDWGLVFGTTGTYTYAVGSLPGAGVQVLTLAATVTDTVPAGRDQITNTVWVAGEDLEPVQAMVQSALDAAPYLQISKTDGRQIVTPGDTITYTITIANTGDQDATGVVVTDTLPAHTSFVTATYPVTHHNGLVIWPQFELAARARITRTLALQLDDLPWPAGVPVITNTVEAADDGTNGFTQTVRATDVNTVTAGPNLFISKTGQGTVDPGEVMVYELTYLNKGTQHATGVVITETLPDNTTYNAAASTPGWQPADDAGVYTFSVGSLPVGSGDAVNFAVTVADTLPSGVHEITNEVEIGDDGSGGPDLNPIDNRAVHRAPVDAAPDLFADKDDGLDVVAPGQVLTYTLTIGNEGTQGATGVVVTDTLPAATTFITASHGGEPIDGVVVWDRDGELPVGGSFTRTLTIQVKSPVPAGVDAITNTVTVADDGLNGEDLTPESNIGEDVNALQAVPALALVKTDERDSVKPGDVLTYTITITNTGTQDAASVVVTDTLPENTEFVSASGGVEPIDGTVTWPPFALDVDQMVVLTLTVQVDAPLPGGVGQIVNTVEALADDQFPGEASDVTAVEAGPNLRLTKTDGRTHARPGETLTYTLVVDNIGTQGATGVVLTDTFPANVTFVAASGSYNYDEDARVVTWQLTALDVGDVVTRTLTVVIADPWPTGDDTLLVNTATVADDGESGEDLDLDLNTAVDLTRVLAYDIYLPLISKQ